MTLNHNPSVQLVPDEDGTLTVWIDSSGQSVNLFDAEMLAALEATVEHIAATNRYPVVFFRSRKVGCFFAGADVTAIAGLRQADEVRAIITRGQQLMQRLENLQATTVAIIDGMCMGGGFEFALACSYRVATDASHTKLSLPEIRLGLIPGWGGTQRLPKLVGLQQALKMILKGSSLAARKAKQVGLVDRVLASESLESQLERLKADCLAGTLRHAKRHKRLTTRLLEDNPIGRKFVLHITRKRIAEQAPHYPALLEAIEAVAASYAPDGKRYADRGLGDKSAHNGKGYAFEREAFTHLLFSATAQSLLGLFVARDRARKLSTWLPENACESRAASRDSCRRIAVVGAGAMGAGIGAWAAQRGLEVVFKEIDQAASRAGAERVRGLLDKQVAAGRLDEGQRQTAHDRCAFTTHWDDLRDCDLAIEAALEIEAVKRDVFGRLDRCLGQQAPLVSNTSSLSITQIATASGRKSRVAGLHFFNPVQRMELVEVVRTEMTDDATMSQLMDLVKRLGKTPIVTSDKPGFLVNRVLFPYLGEAVRMVAEGTNIVTIDRELKAFGMPMGPLELLDQVGIDIASHVASSLAKIQIDADVPVAFLRDMVERKWLGKKTKLGFYTWSKQQRPNSAIKQQALMTDPQQEFADDGLSSIQRRLVYPMLNEAVHCLDELVVSEPWMVDLGMVLGTGFAPHHGGPLRLIDRIGMDVVLRNMTSLERIYGRRFTPADGLIARARGASLFFQVAIYRIL